MVGVKRLVAAGGLAAVLFGLAGCPSPFLARIKEEIAKAPFTGTAYAFVRQWGNPTPEYSFYSGPVVKADTAGFLYVTDSSSRIRKYNGAGAIQKTFNLISTQGFAGTVYDMAFDTTGNMYVTTNNTNQIQKYDVGGNLLLEWGGATVYGALTLSNPRGIAVDSSGGVYVVDMSRNRVVKFDSSGTYITEWGGATTYGSPLAAMSSPNGIAIDRNGDVYVVDPVNIRILRFNAVTTLPPTLNTWWGGASTYGSPTPYPLYSPEGISVSPGTTQYIYVVDGGGANNSRILKFSTGGSYIIDWGTLGTANSEFNSARSVGVDTSGYIYTTDGTSTDLGWRVQKFDGSPVPPLKPSWVATWGGPPGGADGILAQPWGVALDPSGNTYVAEAKNNRIQKFDTSGTFISKGGSTGTGAGQLRNPAGIAVDASGNILVADANNNRIQVFDSSANFVKTIGAGQLTTPTGVALDGAGNIYVSEGFSGYVRVFDTNGYFLRTIGSPGAGDGQLTYCYALAVDSAGNVYTTDMALYRVQKFDSQGNFVTKWGSQGSADGQFLFPVGITVDMVGNVYVCDMLNRRIQKFDSNGTFLAKFGEVGVGNGTFAWPMGVAVNSVGHLFVTDYMNYLVQEFEPTF
jgi:tripartite motif-containing protein 71